MLGMGRVARLTEPKLISDLVWSVKQHLKLPHVRVAVAENKALGALRTTRKYSTNPVLRLCC